ncbi:MAG: YHS domain-containing protein [Candidatus Zixiibacteriota bacterium]|nr:MAG: YHS domain-containing protein [candidate division Zixibacteria bacterium]
MGKTLPVVLVLWVMIMGLMIMSCAEEEKSPQKVEEIPTEDIGSQALKPQTTDAFSGNPINRSIYADYHGKRIYFCCANSKRQFEEDPERYIAKFRELGVKLEDAPEGR